MHDERVVDEQIAGFEPLDTGKSVPVSTGGVKGKRKSKKARLREAAGGSATRPVATVAPARPEPQEYFPLTPRIPTQRRSGR